MIGPVIKMAGGLVVAFWLFEKEEEKEKRKKKLLPVDRLVSNTDIVRGRPNSGLTISTQQRYVLTKVFRVGQNLGRAFGLIKHTESE